MDRVRSALLCLRLSLRSAALEVFVGANDVGQRFLLVFSVRRRRQKREERDSRRKKSDAISLSSFDLENEEKVKCARAERETA